MACEVAIPDVEGSWVVGEWSGIGRKRDVTVFGILGLGGGDAYWGAFTDQFEELRGKVFVHADTAVGAGAVFHPAGVKSVVGFKFTPVGHRSAFE